VAGWILSDPDHVSVLLWNEGLVGLVVEAGNKIDHDPDLVPVTADADALGQGAGRSDLPGQTRRIGSQEIEDQHRPPFLLIEYLDLGRQRRGHVDFDEEVAVFDEGVDPLYQNLVRRRGRRAQTE